MDDDRKNQFPGITKISWNNQKLLFEITSKTGISKITGITKYACIHRFPSTSKLQSVSLEQKDLPKRIRCALLRALELAPPFAMPGASAPVLPLSTVRSLFHLA